MTKHYKKAGRAVPGIGGAGRGGRVYTRERGLGGGSVSHSRAAAASAAAPAQLPPRPLASSPPAGPGTRRGQGGRPSEARGTRARGPLWTSRPPTSGRSAGHRWPPRLRLALGTVGGAAPRPETSFWDQVGRRGAAWSGAGAVAGGGLASPGSFSRFPLPFPGHSRQGGDEVGARADGSRRSQVPGRPRLGPRASHVPSPPHPTPHASDFSLRPRRPGPPD